MRQKTLAYEKDQDLHWEELPARTRNKIQPLVGQLIERAWQRRKEGKNEPKDNG